MCPGPTTTLESRVEQLTRQTDSYPISDELKDHLKTLSSHSDDNSIDRVIYLFQKKIRQQEQNIWKQHPAADEITRYQNIFKALEQLYSLKTIDHRHRFKIIIPVADRPQHLKQCLQSLLELCRCYEYGGYDDKKYSRVSVLIADDSKYIKNIKQHTAYCAEFSEAGLDTEYFGIEEQLALVKRANAGNSDLTRILPDISDIESAEDFTHKGASVMRNITYLKLHDISSDSEQTSNTLLYFIDSDQEFCITTVDPDTNDDEKHYAINYFYYLDQLFSRSDISVLTGKVVGDPPVSPSVMAGNFQHDIKHFLEVIKNTDPDQPCQFHRDKIDTGDDAAYHDMAKLFGFSDQDKTFSYHCTLQGEHDNSDCFNDFSRKLKRFFHGEHPTRKTYFSYDDGFDTTTQARTVYTGNYVVKPEMLGSFIPFATLKLRMAGPVLGRIFRNKLQHTFVSANLPMLHKRTVEDTGQSEFRPGVINDKTDIDLSDEFVRQFYGDIMLFTIEEITASDFPESAVNAAQLKTIIDTTYERIKSSYLEKHDTILQSRNDISDIVTDSKQWWWQLTCTASNTKTLDNFNDFLKNIEFNFSKTTSAYQQITSSRHSRKHLDAILAAILNYQNDVTNWNAALSNDA